MEAAARPDGPEWSPQRRPLSAHLAELKASGFTVFRGHLRASTVAALRGVLEPVFEQAFDADPTVPKLKLGSASVTGVEAGASWPGGGLLNHPLWDARLAPLLRHPWHSARLLDFCELVMGPRVQMDAFGISGFPPGSTAPRSSAPAADPGGAGGAVVPRPPTFAWHRDNFALSQYYQVHGVPDGGYRGPFYRPPLGVNLLCYLQDMSEATGPLRVVPSSHLGVPPTPTGDAARLPHPQELLLDLKVARRVISDCHFGKTATEYDRKLGIKWLSCTEKVIIGYNPTSRLATWCSSTRT